MDLRNMSLRVYDAMWLIHYGANSVRNKNYEFRGYPLGGVKYLAANVAEELRRGRHVAVCFDSRTAKGSLWPGYKSNRPFQAHIVSQAQFAYNALMKCGILCLRADGYEGDDLIASVVDKYRPDPAKYREIVIVSNDKDTAHNVFGRVRVEAGTESGIDINADNFADVFVKGSVMYNTVSAWKTLTGDSSDNVPAFRSDSGVRGAELYRRYCEYVAENVPDSPARPYLVSRADVFRFFLGKQDWLTERDKEELDRRIRLIFPTAIEISEDAAGIGQVEAKEFAKLLSVLNETLLMSELGLRSVKLSAEEYNEFRTSAQVLRDGTFAVDNGCPLDDRDVGARLF